MKKLALPVLILVIFEVIAISLWLTRDNLFYLFNFSYLGGSLFLGTLLMYRGNKNARRITQLLVGLYLLVYVGIISRENMQIEGFWYYLFLGTFEAATIHYAVAKIFGPLLFGRGWCGYACWSAMVFDFLPYKTPGAYKTPGTNPGRHLGFLRYIVFAVSLIFVIMLFALRVEDLDNVMFKAFIIGNVIYYISGIALAFAFKDNRAFCKYLCPITVFLKPASFFSISKITCDTEKCVSCGKCKKVCPMDVDMTDNSPKRRNKTECILCFECVKACPTKALK